MAAAVVDTPGPHHQIRAVEEAIDLCEANLRGVCDQGESCRLHHFSLPYLWQAHLDTQGWRNLVEESETIERSFSDPGKDECLIEVSPLPVALSVIMVIFNHVNHCRLYVQSLEF